MKAQDADPDKVTDVHIFVRGWGNITAGSDTTGVSLTAVLYYLLRHPTAMQKLRDEVSAAMAEGNCTRSSVPFAKAQRMPYLQACIEETLRVHSAVGLPLWRVVPQGGSEVCGRFFPGGSVVGINTWVAHYNEEVFSSDVEEFKPERWIGVSEEQLKMMNSYWLPLGAGSRTCIGRHISMLEMCKVLPLLVQTFDFKLVGGEKAWETHNQWSVNPAELKVSVSLRD